MELAAQRRNASWRATAIGGGVCILGLALSQRIQSFSGNSGMLLALLLSIAVCSWLAGRWAGLLATAAAAAVVAYFLMPPNDSFAVADPQDSAALGSFAVGGVIISLLCGAAWQLRAEARWLREGEAEMTLLRMRNSRLTLQSTYDKSALAASERFLREFAHAVSAAFEFGDKDCELKHLAQQIEAEAEEPSPCFVNCANFYPASRSVLPTVWADVPEMQLLFDTLLRESVRCGACVEISSSQLPEWWLFVAIFRPPARPLSPLQYSLCERLVIRQGGRCWANTTSQGDWEMRFMLRRLEGAEARS